MIYNSSYDDAYCRWLYDIVNYNAEDGGPTYRYLFECLYNIVFRAKLVMDENRAQDGLELREDFARETNLPVNDETPCSLLEMLIALARRCENQFMHNTDIGDRTSTWFWIMLSNMGLSQYTDNVCFEDIYEAVETAAYKINNRDFYPDGSDGGPFIIENAPKDLRKVEYWYQMCWFTTNYIRAEEEYGR